MLELEKFLFPEKFILKKMILEKIHQKIIFVFLQEGRFDCVTPIT